MCNEGGAIDQSQMSSELIPSEDILAAARDLVENKNPFTAYLAIRDAQLSVGKWNPPALTNKQRSQLQIYDFFLHRFPE